MTEQMVKLVWIAAPDTWEELRTHLITDHGVGGFGTSLSNVVHLHESLHMEKWPQGSRPHYHGRRT